MQDKFPLISVVIPCRNEEKFIGSCLDSIIANHYPQDRIEVLVVDGMSDDGTKHVVEEFGKRHASVILLENPRRVTPAARNMGIRAAKGDIVIFVNAHSILDENFLGCSVEYLAATRADAVGGRLNTINEGASLLSQAIPFAVDSIFGSGGRRYRNRRDEGFVNDTLPYCAYPRTVLEEYGYMDEELIRNQDEELNYRILRRGGKIFFTPKINSRLYIRPSLKKLWRQHFQYGYFKPLVAMKVGTAITWRQLVPAIFVGSLIVSSAFAMFFKTSLLVFTFILACYSAVCLASSLEIALRKGWKYLPVLPVIFLTLHFGYGSGYLRGTWDFLLVKKHKKRKIEDIPLTR